MAVGISMQRAKECCHPLACGSPTGTRWLPGLVLAAARARSPVKHWGLWCMRADKWAGSPQRAGGSKPAGAVHISRGTIIAVALLHTAELPPLPFSFPRLSSTTDLVLTNRHREVRQHPFGANKNMLKHCRTVHPRPIWHCDCGGVRPSFFFNQLFPLPGR